jgi:hypothetical protein
VSEIKYLQHIFDAGRAKFSAASALEIVKNSRAMLSKRSALTILVVINTVIFSLLSLLHFYWAFGGKLWLDNVLPTSSNGLHKFNPGMMATLVVASGLLFLALITVGNKGLFDKYINRKYFGYGALIIAVIFFSRAIGDFKFIGLFKTIRSTRFAINDTQFFSPLCLFIAVFSVLIFVFSKPVMTKV